MKIAIDSGPLTGGDAVRGIGAYTRELIEGLKILRYKDIKIFDVDFRNADLSNYDLLHFPYFHSYFLTLPLSKKTKWIVTIHDLIPLIYPEHYPSGIRGKIKSLIQRQSLGKAEGIIAVSQTTKKDIVRFLGIPEGKIEVIYEAPREVFKRLEVRDQKLVGIRKKYNLPPHFVLYVGDVNYNKNILSLADACKIAKVPLVIVGRQAATTDVDFTHVENQPFAHFLEKYGEDPSIVRLGYINNGDLVAIYNLASLYCQPSFYEGFGLPVLEAFACGTPVVAARTQALVEIAQGAALFADPLNPKDIAEKIDTLFKNSELRAQLMRKGAKRVKDFSWQRAAKETINCYKKVLEG